MRTRNYGRMQPRIASEKFGGLNMKNLGQFIKFDWNAFCESKRFMATGQRPWLSRDTKEPLGTLVDTVIVADKTVYQKEGNNLYEKVTFKLGKKIDNIPMNAEIIPKNVVAVVYGDYRNQLSCTAEDIEVIAGK